MFGSIFGSEFFAEIWRRLGGISPTQPAYMDDFIIVDAVDRFAAVSDIGRFVTVPSVDGRFVEVTR